MIAGRIRSCVQENGDVCIEIRQRDDGNVRKVVVGAVVNCTGPDNDIKKLNSPLIVQLLQDGLIQQDPMKLGLEVDDTYQVIGENGRPVQGLFYVGPMLKARYWEAIAIPELRGHTLRLATKILTEEAFR